MAVPKITGVDWDLVNEDAANWARDHGGRLVKDISKTTRRRVGNSVANFYEEGQTIGELGGSMEDFEDELGNIFGPQRAEMIAVTEVTRAAAEGEREMAKELAKDGIIMVEIWETRNDGIVCSTCEPRQGKQQGDGWTASDGPPGHPNCRCNIRHEFPKPKEGEVEVPADFMEDISVVDPMDRLVYEETYELGEIKPVSELSTGEATIDQAADTFIRRGEVVYSQEVQARVKNDIVHNLASRSGLNYDDVNDMVRNWASTSNDNDYLALQMQERAGEMFDIDLSDWQKQSIQQTRDYIPPRTPSPFTDAEVDRFLRAMYDNTQEQLSKAGINSIRLQRGIDLSVDEVQLIMDQIQLGDQVGINSNAMESWTTDPRISSKFGNTTLEANVPANRIIGSARTGFGCLDEYEFIVIGSDADEYASLANLWPE